MFRLIISKIPMKISVPLLLTVPVLSVVIILSVIAWTEAQSTVNDLMEQNLVRIHDLTEERLKELLHLPKQIQLINANLIGKGSLSLNNLRSWRQMLFDQVQAFNGLSSITWGGADGRSVGVARIPDTVGYEFSIKDEHTGKNLQKYYFDEQGQMDKEPIGIYHYDPRDQPWYIAAIKKDKSTWTDTYARVRKGGSGITIALGYAQPFRDDNGQIIGVMNAELTLDDITSFLQQLRVGSTGKAFLIDQKGRLIATSSGVPVTDIDNYQLLASVSGDRHIATAAKHIKASFTSLKAIEARYQLRTIIDGKPHLLMISPSDHGTGLTWIISTFVPESEFLTEIKAGRQRSINIGIFAVLVTLGLGIVLAIISIRPILDLAAYVQRVGQGNLEGELKLEYSTEFVQLSKEINAMTAGLKDRMRLFAELSESKEQLEEHSRTLEQKVEVRTRELARSVEELKALGEVSQVVSSTLDLETVLTSIVRHAVQLSKTDAGTIYEFEEAEQVFVPRINYGVSAELIEALRESKQRVGDRTVIGQSAKKRASDQVADLADVPDYPLRQVQQAGYRALLALPLLREDRLIGGLIVRRKAAGEFPAPIVDLLQTFAAQSVLAIHNAQLFREIEEKGRELQIVSKHKSEFLANMSHELRTPLNAILGYTELILDNIYGDVPEKIQEVLERLEKNGRHLLSRINDVLDLSKIEAGRLTLSLNEYSMGEVIQTVFTSVEALAAEKKLGLKVKVPKDLTTGKGDEQRIAQVLLNLLGNAIKFTEQGEVTVEAGVSDETFLISVSDTGPGLAEADQDKIFEEFRQADGSSTRQKGGTGLGLSISKKIIEMHGGRIWVESTPGEGATFRFILPIRVEKQMEQK